MTSCYNTFRKKLSRCDCSLKTWGFIAGWLGVIWKAVATVFLATIISKLSEHDPSLYEISMVTILSYVQISLVANLFFIAGIQKDIPYLMLPYIVVSGMDLFVGLFGLLVGIWLFHGYNIDYALTYFIPIAIFIIGIYFVLWIQSINLFRNMEVEITRRKEDNARLASIRQSYVNND